jgi:hypothetical protein
MMAAIGARKRGELFERFRERGALSADTALTREELEVEGNPMFHMEARSGAVVEVAGGRYYLDLEVAARQERSRDRLILGLLAILIVSLVIFWLAG